MAFKKFRQRLRNRRAKRKSYRQARFSAGGGYAGRRVRRRRRVKRGFQIAGIGLLPLTMIVFAAYMFIPAVKVKIDGIIKR